jgi:soluble lytic murein transglycosylase-like protein/tetratricopeptide (TPR) repeat protein
MSSSSPPTLALIPGIALLLVAALSVPQLLSGDRAPTSATVAPASSARPAPRPPPEILAATEAIPERAPTARDLRAWMVAGRPDVALPGAIALARTDHGVTGDAAAILAATLSIDAGRPLAALDLLSPVSTRAGPLAGHAGHLLASTALDLGMPATALHACDRYLSRWPDGTEAGSCLAITAFAHAALGQRTAALDAASRYDDSHNDGISEQVRLALAESALGTDPERALTEYRALAVYHRTPLVGRIAEERLADLRAAGHADAVLPDDVDSALARATSLRVSRRRDAAWGAFEDLTERGRKDPALAARLIPEERTFAWHTWRWVPLEAMTRKRIADSPSEGLAWDLVKVLGRDGRWSEAADEASRGLKRYASFSRKREEIARIYMLAGRYDAAIELFDALARSGGWSGRRAGWLGGFCAFMAGRDADAVARFDKVLATSTTYEIEARYWRSRANARRGRVEAAEADRSFIRAEQPRGWYGALVGPALPPVGHPWARDGAWPGAEMPSVATIRRTTPAPSDVTSGARSMVDAVLGPPSWAGFPAGAAVLRDLERPPSAPPPGALFDEQAAERTLTAFAHANQEAWPELVEVLHLARVGLTDVSGPTMARLYGVRKSALRAAGHPRHHAALRARASTQEWRDMFLFAGDHHDVARLLAGSWPDRLSPSLALEARRIAWPLAHARPVWRHARAHNVDPYLVLGLMRQESTYDAVAVSHAGARGAMQIMPRTGHLLAELASDQSFATSDLEDPVVAVGYGIRYLGLLMKRFDGVFPLAVASYNAGPHNVHAWLAGGGASMPMDAFVEHIPIRETNEYVKRVTGHYATYLWLYAPDGTALVVPPAPKGDDPTVVDF